LRKTPVYSYSLFSVAQKNLLTTQLVYEVYEVGTLAVDGWAVTFGTARRELGGRRTPACPGPS